MQSLSTFKKKGHRLPPFNERSVKEFVAIFNPPQKLTEREMYLISKIHKRLVTLVAGIYKGPLQTKKRTAAPIKKKSGQRLYKGNVQKWELISNTKKC